MGIRNLAYCILDLPPQKPKQAKPLPILQSWHRLSVSQAPINHGDDGTVAKEVFDPATLSTIAYTLLRDRLLAMKPDFVLIERQRFRSMGSKHILEWTIRVNMFESILYAVLHTLKEEGIWEGVVVPVLPGKVGPFWIGEDVDEGTPEDGVGETGKEGKKKKVRTSKNAKVKNKGAKIDLVRGWCGSGDMVTWGNKEVEDMVNAYVDKWDRRPGGVKGPKGPKKELVEGQEKMGKLDDLADCLLQGMAWVQWEENKRMALKYGVEALLEPEENQT